MVRQIRKYDQDGLFEISEESNGEEGWEFCRKYKPELVLTDIRMPKMDGIQLLQEIRDNTFVYIFLNNHLNYHRYKIRTLYSSDYGSF